MSPASSTATPDVDGGARLVLPEIEAGGARMPIDAEQGAPRILFDPSSITLLPDASLRLDLPEALDAGSSP
jgi:hypothetical protein